MGWTTTKNPGLYVRHRKACPAIAGGRCRCERSWRVRYRDDTGPKWSHVFANEDEARSWQVERKNAPPPSVHPHAIDKTFNELADEWFALADSGAISQKGGRRYSSGTLDTYSRMYTNHVRDELGPRLAATLTAKDWQSWLDSRVRVGLKRNSISVTLNAVRSIYRWACSPNRAMLAVNATRALELPAHDETPRDRVASYDEGRALLGALRPSDRVAYGLALYAGLRNVERRHLDWTDLDLAVGRLRVRISKSDAGIRTMGISAPLKLILLAEFMRQGRPERGLVCRGPKGGAPEYDAQVTRARKAWMAANLTPIGFHECRHTFISTMVAAGLNAKAVSVAAGHASIAVTYDRYGHLFAGHEDAAAARL